MPPPKKRVMRLRAACLKRWSAPASQNASPVAPSGEFLPADSSDDDVYVYESDIEVADDAVDSAETIVLKWKEGAKPNRSAVYQKDSRTTKWRRSKERAQRVASVAGCRRITDFLPKILKSDVSGVNSIDCPSDSSSDDDNSGVGYSQCSIDEALTAVASYCSVSVNRNHERRLGSLKNMIMSAI